MKDSNELMARFDRLQRKRDEANTKIITLQAKIDNANEAIKQITEGWKQTYGFTTYEEAVQKLNELESEINTTLDACEAYLVGVEDNGGLEPLSTNED